MNLDFLLFNLKITLSQNCLPNNNIIIKLKNENYYNERVTSISADFIFS